MTDNPITNERKIKNVTSAWGFTINPNNGQVKSLYTAENEASTLRLAIKNLLSSRSHLKNIIKIEKPGDSFDGNVKNISSSVSVELGEKLRGRRIHAHFFLKIQHDTKVQMDLDAMGDYFKNTLGLDHYPHITYRLVKSEENWLNYMRKR